MASLDKLNRVLIQKIGNVSAANSRPAVFVDLRVYVGALSFKAYPPIKTRARRVVVSHVPLADESRGVTCLLQQQRKRNQFMACNRTIDVVCYAVSVCILSGQETGP